MGVCIRQPSKKPIGWTVHTAKCGEPVFQGGVFFFFFFFSFSLQVRDRCGEAVFHLLCLKSETDICCQALLPEVVHKASAWNRRMKQR